MSYPGGKGASGVVQAIINQQPPHELYAELFLGGGAVMRAKRPAKLNIGIDLEPGPIAAFDVAADSNLELFCMDALDWLDANLYSLSRFDLIYCDPPYPLSSRGRNRRIYRREMDDAGHFQLLTRLLLCPCFIQISTYANPLYAEMLSDWRKITFPSMTRGGIREETLYMNYPEPEALHDYRFLGANFRERERIGRKTQRWTARIANLATLERLAIFSAMSEIMKNKSVRSCTVKNELVSQQDSPAISMPLAMHDRTSLEMVAPHA